MNNVASNSNIYLPPTLPLLLKLNRFDFLAAIEPVIFFGQPCFKVLTIQSVQFVSYENIVAGKMIVALSAKTANHFVFVSPIADTNGLSASRQTEQKIKITWSLAAKKTYSFDLPYTRNHNRTVQYLALGSAF